MNDLELAKAHFIEFGQARQARIDFSPKRLPKCSERPTG